MKYPTTDFANHRANFYIDNHEFILFIFCVHDVNVVQGRLTRVTNLKQHSWGARLGLHPHISYYVHEFTHISIVRIFMVVISYALVLS